MVASNNNNSNGTGTSTAVRFMLAPDPQNVSGSGEGTGKPKLLPNQQANKRQTIPQNWNPFALGGLGIIARRGALSTPMGATKDALANFATSSPMRLLAILPDVHPSVGLAVWNALRLACPVDGTRVAAVKKSKRPKGKTSPDDDATLALDALWKSLPSEIGGFMGLQISLTLQALFTGLIAVEGVPGPASKGLSRVWPIDSLTLAFGRTGWSDDLQPYQRQRSIIFQYAQSTGQVQPIYTQSRAMQLGFIPLNKETFFWRALDAFVDEPYGRAPYAPALSEVLRDLALIQDLSDAIHNAAWPRLSIGFNFAEMHKVAVEVMRITDPKRAAEWVQSQFDAVVAYVGTLNPDDNFVSDTSGHVQAVQPGSFGGLAPVLNFLRHRIVQSLKSLPTLMGITEGGSYNYTSVEWGIYATGLETLRGFVNEVILAIANLHLRCMGSTSEAVIESKPIRTNDDLIDANTESVRIANAQDKRNNGWIDNSEAAQEVVGHAPVADPLPSTQDIKSQFMDQGGAPAGQGQGGSGQSSEERNAQKQQKDNRNPGKRADRTDHELEEMLV